MRFTKPSKIVGLDIGSHSVKAVQMSKSGGKLQIDDVGYALVDRNQVNLDPVMAHATALNEAIRTMPISQCLIVGALPGQTVVIRYPRLQDMALDQIDAAIEKEAGQNIPYDLFEVFLDWSILEEETEGDTTQLKVLLVAAKHEVIDSRVQIAAAANIQYGVLSVDSLALADAAEGCDLLRVGETVALVNIGASSVSIHFTKDGISNFVRDVSWGAREMIQAVAKGRRCDYDQAEALLYNLEEELTNEAQQAQESQGTPDFEESPADAIADSDALDIDDGGSLLDPLDDELDALGEAEPAPSIGAADATDDMGAIGGMGGPEEEGSIADALSLPISRLVTEIRKSLQYYEHQLYERPVDRIILSGGVAHLSLIRDALMDDLGIEDVQVADPSEGAIIPPSSTNVREFNEHPAQFMVAIGLAARGVAEL